MRLTMTTGLRIAVLKVKNFQKMRKSLPFVFELKRPVIWQV